MLPFEDIIWLFNCGETSRNIVRLNLDEGAYLYKVARSLNDSSKVLEVGRFKGGSTVLLACAVSKGRIDSVDIRPQDDRSVLQILQNLKLSNVNLIINDINELEFENDKYDLIFIDGDHSYHGIRKDFEHLKNALKQGGHLLFHDYPILPGVRRVIDEVVVKDINFNRVNQVTSLIHFVKSKNG